MKIQESVVLKKIKLFIIFIYINCDLYKQKCVHK